MGIYNALARYYSLETRHESQNAITGRSVISGTCAVFVAECPSTRVEAWEAVSAGYWTDKRSTFTVAPANPVVRR